MFLIKQKVLTEQQFRTTFKFNMEEKPENYENDNLELCFELT